MNPRRLLLILALVVAVVAPAAAFLACRSADPSANPAPVATASAGEASGKKLGVAVNSSYEVGALVVEQGVGGGWLKAAADSTADSGTAESVFAVVGSGPSNIPISSCQFAPAATLTASNTQYASISVWKRTSPQADGGTTRTMIAQTTTAITASDAGTDAATGNWSAFQNITIPTVTGAFVTPGDEVTVTIDKTGGGVAVPAGELNCFTTLQ